LPDECVSHTYSDRPLRCANAARPEIAPYGGMRRRAAHQIACRCTHCQCLKWCICTLCGLSWDVDGQRPFPWTEATNTSGVQTVSTSWPEPGRPAGLTASGRTTRRAVILPVSLWNTARPGGRTNYPTSVTLP